MSDDTKPTLTGAKQDRISNYYLVEVEAPMDPTLPPYFVECADIIEALNMTFNEGEAFKALWRLAASRQGRGKPGTKAQYDADKVAHYGSRVAAQTKKAEFTFPEEALSRTYSKLPDVPGGYQLQKEGTPSYGRVHPYSTEGASTTEVSIARKVEIHRPRDALDDITYIKTPPM